MTSTVTIQGRPSSTPPRYADAIGRGAARLLTTLSSWLRPRPEHPAVAAERLRRLADRYRSQPSFAADLRAAADRHNNFGEG